MNRSIFLSLVLVALAVPAYAASQAEAQAAYAAAQAAHAQAVAAKTAWTPGEAALKKAREALDAKQWDDAKAAAETVQTLARLSMQQARDQKDLWRNAVLR